MDLKYSILNSDQLSDLKKILKADVIHSISQKFDSQSINEKKALLSRLENELKERTSGNPSVTPA